MCKKCTPAINLSPSCCVLIFQGRQSADQHVNLVCAFFLKNGKHDEAWMILKQVHDTNMRAKGYPERVFSVSHSQFTLEKRM